MGMRYVLIDYRRGRRELIVVPREEVMTGVVKIGAAFILRRCARQMQMRVRWWAKTARTLRRATGGGQRPAAHVWAMPWSLFWCLQMSPLSCLASQKGPMK